MLSQVPAGALVDAMPRKRLAAFAARRPAPSADAPGGVRALATASDAAIAELVAWVDATR